MIDSFVSQPMCSTADYPVLSITTYWTSF